ncbi:nucleotide-diphospho-sugar transferase [Epithele typhae]|uniref:nucleotide-diphospho-sugar transferase n=1 Tax=Epithele typhae TaxID=378194 RepID=UPI0020075B7E|nr:nucleotide-diphospho-sugar transferase [Epithele typhae]KAH9920009.1 nucleotide-diphospho-sugar transferase [Epithele typhae]
MQNTIVVPAYRENGNLRPLVTRIFAALSQPGSPADARATEVIIVDDNSRDGSVETVDGLRREGYNVRIIVRTTERGLSSAVVRGFREARGDNMLCMDADLQHPPEYVPAMLSALSPTKEFVLGTRYAKGVQIDEGWPLYRRVISNGARMLALPLTAASDPMSGFFGLRRERFLKGRNLNADGFKIALDILVKCSVPSSAIAEVPFSFGVRAEGESKLTGKVMVRYLEQLAELYWWQYPMLVVLGGIAAVVVFIMMLQTALNWITA